MFSETATAPAPLLTAVTTEEEAANLLATGKVKPADFVTWMRAKNGSANRSWHPSPPRLKVSQKGCIHLGGCHNKQFGLTLYVSTVEYLFSIREQVESFIRANNGRLARK
jgi:hypothetical protein